MVLRISGIEETERNGMNSVLRLAMTLIKDLIEIPEQIHKDDFVLKLAEGVTRAENTLREYVVTPELRKCFDDALGFIKAGSRRRPARRLTCTAASVAARAISWPCCT